MVSVRFWSRRFICSLHWGCVFKGVLNLPATECTSPRNPVVGLNSFLDVRIITFSIESSPVVSFKIIPHPIHQRVCVSQGLKTGSILLLHSKGCLRRLWTKKRLFLGQPAPPIPRVICRNRFTL
jgi:hypothetical protein